MKNKILILLSVPFLLTACGEKEKEEEKDKPIDVNVLADKTPILYQDVDTSTYDTYYFDSINGSDLNDGKTSETPLKSLEKAENIIANTNNSKTQLLFKAGSLYSSKFTINGQFSDEFPLIIGAYGKTPEHEYATIDVNSADECIEINSSNVRLFDFECINKNGLRGIYVNTKTSGVLDNLVIENNYIHNVNYNWTYDFAIGDKDAAEINPTEVCSNNKFIYTNGGIIFDAGTDRYMGPSWFENIYVNKNKIEAVSRSGLFVQSQWVNRPGIGWGYNKYCNDNVGWYPHKNFNILQNDISYTGGDGIVLICAIDSFIDGNNCKHAQYLGRSYSDNNATYNAGIWCHSCKNLYFQNNQASFTHKDNGAGDGEGFDIDIGNSNIIFRNNFAYMNEGGGLLMCNNVSSFIFYDENGDVLLDDMGLPKIEYNVVANWKDIYVFNNILSDNYDSTFVYHGKCDNSYLFNNSVSVDFTKSKGNSHVLINANYSAYLGLTENLQFMNNLVVCKNSGILKSNIGALNNFTFKNNSYSGADSAFIENEKNVEDPLYEEEIALDSTSNINSFKVSSGYSGIETTFISESDFYGNKCNSNFYIGAYYEK